MQTSLRFLKINIFCLMAMWLVSSHAIADWKTTLAGVGKKVLVTSLSGKTFEFEEAPFVGKIQAIEPEKNIDVSVTKLAWAANKLSLNVSATGKFVVQATAKKDDPAAEDTSFDTYVKLSISVEAEADVRVDAKSLILTPHIVKLTPIIEVEKVVPDQGALGGLLAKGVKKMIEDHADDLKRAMEIQLKEVRFDYEEALCKAVRDEAQAHQSEESAWYSEQIERFSEVKTWLWIDNPDSASGSVHGFDLKDDAIEFSLRVNANVKGKAWGKISRAVKGDVRMTGKLELELKGRLELAGDGPCKVDIASIEASLSDLKLNNDLLNAFRSPIQKCVNQYFEDSKDAWKEQIERAIAESLALLAK